jgi:hypothetical protein
MCSSLRQFGNHFDRVSSSGCTLFYHTYLTIQIHCFCTARGFHVGIAPCIVDTCEEKDQIQTEQYARGICSIVGVDLPPFQELLASQGVTVTSADSTVTISSSPLPTPANQTSINSIASPMTSTTTAVDSTATVNTSAAATGVVSSADGLRVSGPIITVFGIISGMFLAYE